MRLHHLGYVGRDLQTLLRRFQAEGAEPIGEPVPDPVQRVVVQFVQQPGSGELWELVVPLSCVEDSPLRGRLARGGGLDHICYELEAGDGPLEQVLRQERDRGGQIVCEPVMATAFGRRIAFVFRRSGRLVELVEPRPPGGLL
ncbi:MAG: VOC family protein [Myxococcales bacterium]|nr:VOC family protein [Myxococcota bacterium]MDW8280363.1 VOC family protein [Myxococcales bacterium]